MGLGGGAGWRPKAELMQRMKKLGWLGRGDVGGCAVVKMGLDLTGVDNSAGTIRVSLTKSLSYPCGLLLICWLGLDTKGGTMLTLVVLNGASSRIMPAAVVVSVPGGVAEAHTGCEGEAMVLGLPSASSRTIGDTPISSATMRFSMLARTVSVCESTVVMPSVSGARSEGAVVVIR